MLQSATMDTAARGLSSSRRALSLEETLEACRRRGYPAAGFGAGGACEVAVYVGDGVGGGAEGGVEVGEIGVKTIRVQSKSYRRLSGL